MSGQKIIKMADLKKAYEKSGFQNVKTYVQSGNVIFQIAKAHPLKLSEKISETILKVFGFEVAVIVKTSEEMNQVIQNNPFLKEKQIDRTRLYVTFLSQAPEIAALKKLDGIEHGMDQFHCRNNEVYLYCPDGYGRAKLSNNFFEKIFSSVATTRNWRTVTNLHEEAGFLDGK